MTGYLVTGGAGFIGSHLVAALAGAGHVVRVLDDLSQGRIDNLLGCIRDVDVIEADVRDLDRVRHAARGVAGIFHLAALGSVPRSFDDPASTLAINIEGTRAVMEAARAERVGRVVFASSSSVYGKGGGPRRRETDPTVPLSPYAESKLAAERICLSREPGGEPEAVVLRYFNVFGPRQDHSSRYAAAIPRFIAGFASGSPPQVYGDGEQTRDFTYVGDVVAGTVAAMGVPQAAGRVANLGAGRATSVNGLVALIRELVGSKVEAAAGPARAGEVRHSVADLTLARRLLGYAPRWTLRDGLRATIAWHRKGSEANCR